MSDLYKGSLLLADYLNEFCGVLVALSRIQHEKGIPAQHRGLKSADEKDFRTAIAKAPIRTVEERFNGKDPSMMVEAKRFPETVARINKIAALANEGDLITFKRVFNEMERLMHGKNVPLAFPEPEFNPDHLEI